MKAIMAGFGAKLYRKSISAVALLENSLPRIMLGWVAFVTLAGVLRTIFAVSPIDSGLSFVQTIMPYILLGGAPIAAYWVADQVFPRGALMQQPAIRLARYGKGHFHFICLNYIGKFSIISLGVDVGWSC